LYRVIKEGWPQERVFQLMHELWQPDDVWASFIARMLDKHATG
jgi:hypothetical protein